MIEKERIESNEIIATFLDWECTPNYSTTVEQTKYKVPIGFDSNNGFNQLSPNEFLFDSDWNWCLMAWNKLHREVLVPISKDNPHLRREVNDMIKDMRSALKWVHIEGAFKTMVKILTWYENQFK